MSRRVTIEATVQVIVDMEDGYEVGEVMTESEFVVRDLPFKIGTVHNVEVIDFNVTDSR